MSPFFLVFISGLTIGIMGSFHCVGMCGPLALALPVNNLSRFSKTAAILNYNLGRALSYTSLGIITGLLGRSFSLFHFQQFLSITAGILILTILLINQFATRGINILSGFTQKIKSKLSAYLTAEKKLITYLYIGILNGLLPCGLVYIAMGASLAAGSILKSSIMMFAFGLGTLPVMALMMFLGKFISFRLRYILNKITPYFIMCVAVLLILRGLNLGIPYMSPTQDCHHVSCCHK